MRIHDWQDVVRDVVESDVDPDGWRAIAGQRDAGLGEDLYLAHPRSGVFLLKTYTKNPFERKGVGTRVARSLDDEIGPYLPDEGSDRFAVHSRPADSSEAETRAKRLRQTVQSHKHGPESGDEFFDDVMQAIGSPAYGPMTFESGSRPEPLDGLANTFEEAEDVLNAEIQDLIDTDGIDRGFG